jgi:hypothetical protein
VSRFDGRGCAWVACHLHPVQSVLCDSGGKFARPVAGRWVGGGGSAIARVVPGQCRAEPHPAATPGPAAPVNKARISFLGGLKRAAELSS